MCQDSSPKTDTPEPAPEWYSRTEGFFGNPTVHCIASIIYIVVALAPLVLFALTGVIPRWLTTHVAFLWALFVSAAYPVWSWTETLAFERWVREFDENTRERERAYYSLMRDHAKSFWAGLLAVYTIAGLWGLILKGAQ
jgi:hypothetical protein